VLDLKRHSIHCTQQLHHPFKSPIVVPVRSTCTCGYRPLGQVKIVGGQLSEENNWPWVVPLVYVENGTVMQFCGSSLINSQYLLTASHCVMDIKTEDLAKYQALLGTNSISNPNATVAYIQEIKMHPMYVHFLLLCCEVNKYFVMQCFRFYRFNRTTLDYDIALIKLTKRVPFTPTVRPVCLKQTGSPYVGIAGTVAGWGTLVKGGTPVDRLRETKIRVLNNVECAKNYSVNGVQITGKMLCARLPGKDSCQGDSGGPFFLKIRNANVFTQIGIVSFGVDCASPQFPGVYTRVNSFLKWIIDNTQDAFYCKKSF
ncbi:Transmembrane protease serine 9, partial [Orchesella cincta]